MQEIDTDPSQNSEPLLAAELLVHCLRGSQLAVAPNTDWQELLRLAEKHGVLPLIHRTLSTHEIDMPDFFIRAAIACRAAIETLSENLACILAGFAQHGIAVMPLKGPVLAETLYGDIFLRPSTDLDLLVQHDDFSRAEELLIDAGWEAQKSADSYHRVFLRKDAMVELHFDITPPQPFSFDLAAIWKRSTCGSFRGQPIRAMSRNDLILYLCAHGMKHGFYRLIWSTDIMRALQSMNDCELQSLIGESQAQGLELVLCIGCEMAREVFPENLPAYILTAEIFSPRLREKARTGVRRLLAGGREASLGPEIWSLHLQTTSNRSERWIRRLKSLAPTREDHLWAERHRVHRSFMPVLRPFRLLMKHGPKRIWRNMFPPVE